jgi:hypothetical protein
LLTDFIPIPVTFLLYAQIQLTYYSEFLFSNLIFQNPFKIGESKKKAIWWSLSGLIFLIIGYWDLILPYFQNIMSPFIFSLFSILYSILSSILSPVSPHHFGLSLFICAWIIAGCYDLNYVKDLEKFLTNSLRELNISESLYAKIELKLALLHEGKRLLLIPPLAIIGLYLALIAEMDLSELFDKISN